MPPVTLKVFRFDGGGTDWVIAIDKADAWHEWHLHTGESPDDYAAEMEPMELPPDEVLTIWCDSNGNPSEIDGDGCEPVKQTAGDWAIKRGRGFLCSTEV